MDEKDEKDVADNPTPSVCDDMGFFVSVDYIDEFFKQSSSEKKRHKKLKARWDALIKKNKWNLSIDSDDPRTIVTSKTNCQQRQSND